MKKRMSLFVLKIVGAIGNTFLIAPIARAGVIQGVEMVVKKEDHQNNPSVDLPRVRCEAVIPSQQKIKITFSEIFYGVKLPLDFFQETNFIPEISYSHMPLGHGRK